ncbi:SusC/RagA family TonB-linked outer membrane protein [Flavihumibacter solisilvae]|uniref:SusC/RagA family TonB-linked outer membrane protein n=1 Tax=Flavihumibacter solisilvae TaxID=1349421 RepID=UPI000A73F99A|nr:SusC/RagA family TonB-linked outer membrane protein [Flavihumibacter solisilvae]
MLKLLFLFMLAGCLQLSANTYGQRLTLSRKQATLPELFVDIYRQGGYFFFYSSDLMSQARKVDIAVKNASIEEVLVICFTGQPLSYHRDGKVIIVRERTTSPAPLDTSHIEVAGRILTEKDEPLEGASITVEETGQTVASAANGGFRMPGIPKGSTLVISNVGYQSHRVKAVTTREMIIRLAVQNQKLDEVRIIGYGTTTQRLSTGSISKVSSEVIAKQPVTNVLQALIGRAPGVQITQGNGLPGSPVTVRIRGQNSIAANNNPLYVVDGVPFVSQPMEVVPGPNGDGTSNGSPLNMLNPADIASIEVLKDADATAIYGSRAANGVILITTKKGQAGKTNLQVDVQGGFGSVSRFVPYAGWTAYAQARRDGLANSAITPTPGNSPDLLVWDSTKLTDWQDWYMGDNTTRTVATASLTGGNAQTQFLLSGTYHQEGVVLPGDNRYRRIATHLSVGHQSPDKRFQVSSSMYFTTNYNKLSGFTPGFLADVAAAVPNYPVYDTTGKYYWAPGFTNYVALLNAYVKTRTDQLNGSVNLRFTILPGMDLRLNAGFNQVNLRQNSANPSTAQNPGLNETPSANFGNRQSRLYLAEPQLAYKRRIGLGTLDVLVGGTIQHSESSSQRIILNNFANDALLENINFGTVVNKSGQLYEYRYMSAFGRLGFNFRDRYILNGSFRRDGSSRFGPGSQFGNFGSVGAAWIFSNENFIKATFPLLSFGKLRGSYGTTGNDGIPDYGYLATYYSYQPYGTTNTLLPAQLANPNFQWEVNRKLELALELGLMDNRVLFSAAWYRNRSDNQLVGYPLPAMTGFTSYQANLPALVENSGWELELTTSNIKRQSFEWNTSLNISLPRNELLSFPNLAATSYANQYVEAESLNIVQWFRFSGVDPATGLPAVEDVNKDGVLSQGTSHNGKNGDFVIAGQTNPRWFGGLNNSLQWKRMQLDFFLQYVSQQGYNMYYYYSQLGRSYNFPEEFMQYWRQPGQTSSSPKPFAQFNSAVSQYIQSDAIFGDASYLRLKNVSISYDCSSDWLKRAKIQSLTVYAQAQNLFTITGFNGFDPETANSTRLQIPPLRMFVGGIKCSF